MGRALPAFAPVFVPLMTRASSLRARSTARNSRRPNSSASGPVSGNIAPSQIVRSSPTSPGSDTTRQSGEASGAHVASPRHTEGAPAEAVHARAEHDGRSDVDGAGAGSTRGGRKNPAPPMAGAHRPSTAPARHSP